MRFRRFGNDHASGSIALLTSSILLLSALSRAHPTSSQHQQSPAPKTLFERSTLDNIAGIFNNDEVDGYAPFKVTCPRGDNATIVRIAGKMGPEEKEWLKGRKGVVTNALRDFLGRMNLTDFDYNAFINDYTPTVGMAFSGGGYRAMLSGAGVISAFDSRTPDSTKPGALGGLLQGTTYLAGLSGGSWLVGTMVVNDFLSIPDIQNSSVLWDLEYSILSPKGKPVDYYPSVFAQVDAKEDAGYDVTLTDLWSAMLARQFIDQPDGGPNVTFSSVATSRAFTSFQMPFPIIIADGRAPGETLISLNATVFEINPIEFGSHDPTVYAFTKTKLLGSDLENGKPESGGNCANGFDSAAFVMGTSSSLFNSLLLTIDPNGEVLGSQKINDLLVSTLESLSEKEVDIADWSPNPFFGINPRNNPSAGTKDLTLVDGGLDLQNIPFAPLLVPYRNVDVIFANDNSADVVYPDLSTVNWPNGTAMVATYQRAVLSLMANVTTFPDVPDQNSFVNLGLNSRPTWFGCDASNFTDGINVPPLVVYIPNAPYTHFSNTSTFQLAYGRAERDAMINNGFLIASQGNALFDPEWPSCVGCAVIHREMERRNAVTEQCRRCLKRYCWDGSRNDTRPDTYLPDLKMEGVIGTSVGEVAGGVGKLNN